MSLWPIMSVLYLQNKRRDHLHHTPRDNGVGKILEGYVVLSKSGERLPGGPYLTRKAAKERRVQINHILCKGHKGKPL